MKIINVQKLTHELQEKEIPIHGCSEDGRIDFKDEATKKQKTLASKILKEHTPDWFEKDILEKLPSAKEQLLKLYQDKANGTNTWFEEIDKIVKNDI
jgi:hypothetical protein